MQVETLNDVLHWTAGLHRTLSERLEKGAEQTRSQRTRLLLDYLSDHEKSLAETLERCEADGISQALNAWFYEYVSNNPLAGLQAAETFAELDVDDIMAEMVKVNDQLLDLYRNLYERANSLSAKELLEGLLELESHEAMQMSQGANRLKDI